MYPKANTVAIGIAVGASSAIAVVVYTLFAYFFGYGIEGEIILDGFFPGYSLSLPGAVIGMIWAFSIGYLFSALIAWFYNQLNGKSS
jgi:hypothetical protein